MKYWVYKIYDKEKPLEFYIGSTNRFSSRKSHHRKNIYNKRNKTYWSKLYVYMRGRGGFDKFQMDIIEEGECNTLKEIRAKEQVYINDLKPTLNSIKAQKQIKPIIEI